MKNNLIKGIPASPGIAIGKAFLYKENNLEKYNKILQAIHYLETVESDIMKNDKIKEIIDIFKTNGESSLSEICDIYQSMYNKKISKSGLNILAG